MKNKFSKIPLWFYVDFNKELSKVSEVEGLTETQRQEAVEQHQREKIEYLSWLNGLNEYADSHVNTENLSGSLVKIGIIKGNYRVLTEDVHQSPFYREDVPSNIISINGFGIWSSGFAEGFDGATEVSLEYWRENIKDMLVEGYNVAWDNFSGSGYIIEKVLIPRNKAASVSLSNSKIREAIRLKFDYVPMNIFIETKCFHHESSFIIPGEPCESINGTYIPTGCLPYLLRKGMIFKCSRFGNYHFEKWSLYL
jgi:hypothetical protein